MATLIYCRWLRLFTAATLLMLSLRLMMPPLDAAELPPLRADAADYALTAATAMLAILAAAITPLMMLLR